MTHSDKTQPQPSLHCPPWLAENSGSLQFPLCAIAQREYKSVCSPKTTNHSCNSKPWQTRQELRPEHKSPRAESFAVKEVEEQETKSAAHKTGPEEKSDRRKKKYKQGDPKGDAAVPKRRRRRKRTIQPQGAAVSLQAHKQVSDRAKSQISLSVCSVSLSSNNVLAKEREMATSSSNFANKFVSQKDETSIIPDSWAAKTRAAKNLITGQTWIRTSGFLKNTQETPSNTCQENSSVLKPMARGTEISDKQGVSGLKRKRGRPRKAKPEERPPAIGEENEQQIDNSLPNEEEAGEKTKKRSRIRKRDRSKVDVIPLKKTKSSESTGTVEADDNSDVIPGERKPGTPKRPRMVTLKEFQNLIKCRHSRTWKSKESEHRGTNLTVRAGESEEEALGSRREESIRETEVDKDGGCSSHSIVGTAVDKNHNQIFKSSTAECNQSHRNDKNGCSSEGNDVLGNENHPSFSFDLLEQEVANIAAKAETPLRTPDEGKVFVPINVTPFFHVKIF